VDDEGTVFAGMQDHVEVFSKDWKKTVWVPPGEKAYLTSIAVDDRYVYVADAGSRRVWRYNKAGGEPLEIGKKDWANGVRGFFIPSPFFDIDSGTDGSLWAVNPGYHALENYRPDGMPISMWEKSSFTIEGFSGCCNPSHFALMPDGSFVTAEKGLPRVKIHNLDGSLRCVVAAPVQFDDGVTGLDVAVDGEGRIYVLDPSRGAVRIFEEKR
jgi:sugar lactone lactonase YvrE